MRETVCYKMLENRSLFSILTDKIVVLVMFNKMLVIFLLSTFTLDIGRDLKNPVFQFLPISNTQC